MAGRGRGRGKTMSFNVEVLGFGRGDVLPATVQQPRPLYPPQIFKPVSLLEGEDYDYMLALKQEFRGAARKSPFYLNLLDKKSDVERYSDKYQITQQESERKWEPDWRQFPAELKPVSKRRSKVTNVKPQLKKIKVSEKDKEAITKKLEILEKTDGKTEDKEEEDEKEDGGGKKKEDDEDEIVDEEVVDDEQLEEETDYGQSYFDNGEGFGEEEEEGDEGPVY